jgi:hypothetical protein
MIEGPTVIFQKDSTILLPPHSRTTVEANDNLLIRLAQNPQPIEKWPWKRRFKACSPRGR